MHHRLPRVTVKRSLGTLEKAGWVDVHLSLDLEAGEPCLSGTPDVHSPPSHISKVVLSTVRGGGPGWTEGSTVFELVVAL